MSFITIYTLCMWFPHIAIDFVFVLDMVILYFLAIRFKWCAIVCKSSDVAIKISDLLYMHAMNVTGKYCHGLEYYSLWRRL